MDEAQIRTLRQQGFPCLGLFGLCMVIVAENLFYRAASAFGHMPVGGKWRVTCEVSAASFTVCLTCSFFHTRVFRTSHVSPLEQDQITTSQ